MSRESLRLYISGPMRGIPRTNFPAFDECRDFLDRIGHFPVSPADNDRRVDPDVETRPGFLTGEPDPDSPLNFAELMIWDLEQVIRADGIVLLPGWEKSAGADLELYIARGMGKRVFRYTPAISGDHGDRMPPWLWEEDETFLSPSEWVPWLAGIIEGEGCINVHTTHKPYGAGEYHYPQIRVRMTDEDVVRRCHEVTAHIGGGVTGPQINNKVPRYKPYWIWTITGDPAREVLRLVLPFLGERRTAKALEVLA